MNLYIKTAQKSDETALKRLFLNSFDDTLGFVNMFFSHHFNPDYTICAYDGDRIVGEAHLLPCEICGAPAFYAYGICVDAELRGNGIGKRIMCAIKDFGKAQNAAIVLHPENADLFAFYENSGFYPCGEWCFETHTATAPPAVLLPCSATEYNEIRNKRFVNLLVWDDGSAEYALTQEMFFGLSAYKVITDNREDIVLCGKDSDGVFIKETTATKETLPAIVSAVAKKFDSADVRVLLPSGDGETVICGYGFNSPKNIYMNLLLD